MALWTAKNKKTGKEYPNFTDEQKAAYLADPMLSGKYTFTVMPGSDKPEAPEPTEARKADKNTIEVEWKQKGEKTRNPLD